MTETQAVDFLVKNGYHAISIKENVVSEDLLLVHPDTIKALRDNSLPYLIYDGIIAISINGG